MMLLGEYIDELNLLAEKYGRDVPISFDMGIFKLPDTSDPNAKVIPDDRRGLFVEFIPATSNGAKVVDGDGKAVDSIAIRPIQFNVKPVPTEVGGPK